jgi:hypothetical protein
LLPSMGAAASGPKRTGTSAMKIYLLMLLISAIVMFAHLADQRVATKQDGI